jgi:hypothetical protein
MQRRLLRCSLGTSLAKKATEFCSRRVEPQATETNTDMLEAGEFGTAVKLKKRHGNFIGGECLAPAGPVFRAHHAGHRPRLQRDPRSADADVERAPDAAHKAKIAWGRTSPSERAGILNRIADRMEQNQAMLAAAETLDNCKPIPAKLPEFTKIRTLLPMHSVKETTACPIRD